MTVISSPLTVGARSQEDFRLCRGGLSFSETSGLHVPAGLNVSLRCPEDTRLELNLHSIAGPPTVASGGQLTITGCDVVTVASREVAASGPLAPEWSSDFFGTSTGTIRLENSRMLMPVEVCVRTDTLRIQLPVCASIAPAQAAIGTIKAFNG